MRHGGKIVHRTTLLWQYEWRQMVKTRSYQATTIIGVLLVLALSLVPKFLPAYTHANVMRVAVLDPSGQLPPC